MNLQVITLGGGCFWCVEAVFECVDGVVAVESGYTNGHVIDPSYAQVCAGNSGHAEVVRVSFDAQRISLAEILEIFFGVHDPTTRDRQGNDIGSQYRSGIYWHEAAQAEVATAVRAEANAAWGGRVVTEIAPLSNYWRAEDGHQHFFAQHPGQGYCAMVVAPKLAKFRKTFKARIKS